MNRVSSLLASLLIACTVNAQAASIVTAERAFENKDYTAALQALEPLARDRDPQALFMLGVMYRDGLGVSTDESRAQSLFESAARQGHLESVDAIRAIKNRAFKVEYDQTLPKAEAGDARAQNRVGEMHEYAQGVERDLDKAFEWYSKAAEQDLVSAWHNLARAYNFGNGVEADYKRAEELYRKAANEGYADSMFFLGTLYATHNGTDTSVDPDILAYAWMHSSAGRGNLTAQTIEQRFLMKLDDQQKAEAEKLATAFKGRFVTPFE